MGARFDDFLAALKERGTKFLNRLNRGTRASAHVRTVLGDAVVDAYNAAQLYRGAAMGCHGVLVQDALLGPETDEPCLRADGELWSIRYALAHKKEHPNCTREFILLSPEDGRALDRVDPVADEPKDG